MAAADGKKRGIWSRRDFFTRFGWGGVRCLYGFDPGRISPLRLSPGSLLAPVDL